MANRQTTAKASGRNGEVTVRHQETDSPIIPVAAMERLQQFKPEAVDWIIQQTQIEAEHRRRERTKINNFIFIEHLTGQISALLIGLSGIGVACYVALNGQPWAGATIGTAAITGLAVVFLKTRK